MIPRGTILYGFELVRKAIIWSNWTLCNSIHTVVLNVIELSDPMPMDRCTIAVKVICDSDFNIITPTCFDPRTRILLVENFALTVLTSIRIECHI